MLSSFFVAPLATGKKMSAMVKNVFSNIVD